MDEAERQVTGRRSWSNVQEMFAVLNAGSPYVVLRNFEGLADLDFLPGHGDIDILTADYGETIALLEAESRIGAVPRWGGRFNVEIGGRKVICDLRFPGDDYFETAWALEILENRRLHPGGFYVPEDDELLDTMLYHAVVHKPYVRRDYQTRLADLGTQRGRSAWTAEALADPNKARALLDERLSARGFTIRRPKDPTVFFNHRVSGAVAPFLRRLLDALRRRIYRLWMRHIRGRIGTRRLFPL